MTSAKVMKRFLPSAVRKRFPPFCVDEVGGRVGVINVRLSKMMFTLRLMNQSKLQLKVVFF